MINYNLAILITILTSSTMGLPTIKNVNLSKLASNCSMTVSSDGKSFSITNKYLLNCKESLIYWSLPQYNMTMKFMANENEDKPFTLCLTKAQYLYKNMPFYRIVNGKETRVEINSDRVCFQNDDGPSKIVTLKCVGPIHIYYYGETINFTIE